MAEIITDVQSTRDAAAVAALATIAEAKIRAPGVLRIVNFAPDSSDDEYGGDTSPGSPWDEECDWRADQVRESLPPGWTVEWIDDDLAIEWVDGGN